MCDDPMHDPAPVLDAVQAQPGMSTTALYAMLYAEYGVTNQATRVGIAVGEGLITRKRVGKATAHYPKGNA